MPACSKCGETLLGSVNRCWRCGAAIQSVAGAEGLPPIRRAPLPESPHAESTTSVMPELVGEEATTVSEEQAPATHSDADAGAPATAAPAPTTGGCPPESAGAETISEIAREPERIDPKIRHGSPFATPSAPAGPIRSPYWDKPAYHQHSIAFAGAIASVVLGIMSLIASFFTLGAVATAILGMAVGVWGLNSNRRGTAVFGLLLCCLAIGIAGVQGSMDLYRQIHGHGPFETPPVIIDE